MDACCVQVKGNVYKNKRVLMEAIHKQKAEKIREKAIADQFEARRAKNKTTRERKIARREERLTSVGTSFGCSILSAGYPDDCCDCDCKSLDASPAKIYQVCSSGSIERSAARNQNEH